MIHICGVQSYLWFRRLTGACNPVGACTATGMHPVGTLHFWAVAGLGGHAQLQACNPIGSFIKQFACLCIFWLHGAAHAMRLLIIQTQVCRWAIVTEQQYRP